ncbi:MAG: lipocalin-like domain-containing protein [Clostridium sp.]|nr:lipocalin-like domain-containing protein [Prevotella sp.]MCM1429143.1 lipocalin-like domain-containing protein [Clostridium sp.]MCM1475329.1 lipocalin-like domain-containing protein [Muribaculaceae bacterium]
MKKIYKITQKIGLVVIAAVILLLTGCRQADGNIGDWFGIWAIDSIYVDGTLDENYADTDYHTALISFQSNIFRLSMTDPDSGELYGGWSHTDKTLTLNNTYNMAGLKKWPSRLGFGDEQIVTFEIKHFSKKKIKLQLTSSDGKIREYNLRKIL